MDLKGPLEWSRAGNYYILTVVDCVTWYAEAGPLRMALASNIATDLMKIFARVGMPREVLTDQCLIMANLRFMSKTVEHSSI